MLILVATMPRRPIAKALVRLIGGAPYIWCPGPARRIWALTGRARSEPHTRRRDVAGCHNSAWT